jgi:hypothetical protein
VNALPPLPGQPVPDRPGLHTRRCVRHDAREAAALCLGCTRDFCRECVVDHSGRLLCATCIARLGRTTATTPRRWAALGRRISLGAAVLVAWVAFFIVGTLLLKIPAEMHEGTIWNSLAEKGP